MLQAGKVMLVVLYLTKLRTPKVGEFYAYGSQQLHYPTIPAGNNSLGAHLNQLPLLK